MANKIKYITDSELIELFHFEMEKTERCWKFWKPLYILLAVIQGLAIIGIIIESYGSI